MKWLQLVSALESHKNKNKKKYCYTNCHMKIVGNPISVPKLESGQTEPTQEQLLATQALYIEELESIYNKYKDVYAKDRKQDMRIVS